MFAEMSLSLAEDNFSSPNPPPPSLRPAEEQSVPETICRSGGCLILSYGKPKNKLTFPLLLPKLPGLARAGKGYGCSYIASHEIHVIHRTCFQSISP